MKYLIFCTCGHGLDRHAVEGCGGDGRVPCRCDRDEGRALDSAIDDARSHPWTSAGFPPEVPETQAV